MDPNEVQKLRPLRTLPGVSQHTVAIEAYRLRADVYFHASSLLTPHYALAQVGKTGTKSRTTDLQGWSEVVSLLRQGVAADPWNLTVWYRLGVSYRKLWDVKLDMEAAGKVAKDGGYFVPDDLARQADRCFAMALRGPVEAEPQAEPDGGKLALQCLEERAVLTYLRLQARMHDCNLAQLAPRRGLTALCAGSGARSVSIGGTCTRR